MWRKERDSLTQGSHLLLNARESMQGRAFGISFHFFLCLWNHFVCRLSLLSLITAPSPGLYHFFSKCEILPWNLSSHDRSGLEDCAISVVCSSANRKKNPRLSFYNVQLACRKRTNSAASLGHLLLCTLASKARAISSAGGGLRAVSIHRASGGPSS